MKFRFARLSHGAVSRTSWAAGFDADLQEARDVSLGCPSHYARLFLALRHRRYMEEVAVLRPRIHAAVLRALIDRTILNAIDAFNSLHGTVWIVEIHHTADGLWLQVLPP